MTLPFDGEVQGGIRVEALEGGAIWRVTLATAKANILDGEKMRRLADVFRWARERPGVRAVLLDADGPHFSFGASVQEHLPGRFRDMLATFRGLIEAMLQSDVLTLASLRGQCLGGALELVTLCHRIFAAPDAILGQPEIRLGVFPPIASVVLVERCGRGAAEDLCLSGRSIGSQEACALGLVDQVADDPSAAALAYATEHLLPLSGTSLRLALRALRSRLRRRIEDELAEVERIYTDELMETHDAVEGLSAFVEKRTPKWRPA